MQRLVIAIASIGLLAGIVACGPQAPSAPPVSPGPPSAVPTGSETAVPSPSLPPPPSESPVAAAWRAAAPMIVGRVGFDAVKLGDGSVLAVGDDMDCYPGPAEPGSERAEVYEPANDRWVEIASLNKPRKTPATVGLADGSAMVLGGINPDDVAYSSTKIVTPAARTWADGPLLRVARGQPLATALNDGRVFVASVVSQGETSYLTTTEYYDQEENEWSDGPPRDGPYFDELLALADGRVLAIGTAFETGLWLEIFAPEGGSWTPIDTPGGRDDRPQFVALADGSVLAVGGFVETESGFAPSNRAWRYDGLKNAWSEVAPLPTSRADATLLSLADGRELVIGGYTGGINGPDESELRAQPVVEAFDPASGQWTALGDLQQSRYGGHAVILDDGSVLVMGGYADFNVAGDVPWCPSPLTSTELLAAP